MKHFFVLLLVGSLGLLTAVAQGPDEQYVRIYNLIQQADALRASGESEQALSRYLEANTALTQIKRVYPTWQPKVVDFRLSYLSEKIEAISGSQPVARPAAATAPSVATPTAASTTTNVNAELQRQLGELQESVRRLQSERQILEAKLKEALSTQPAAIDPRELAKAQDRVQTLLKENELLKAGLEQEKNRPGGASAKELEEARRALAQSNEQLAEQKAANEKLTGEKNALQTRVEQLTTTVAASEALRTENELLKKQLTQAREELAKPAAAVAGESETARKLAEAEARIAALRSDAEMLRLEKVALEDRLKQTVTAPAPRSGNVGREVDLQRIQELERQRDVFRKQLEAVSLEARSDTSRVLSNKVAELTREVASLKARVEVFEAKAIPYTAEELALFQKPAPKPAPAPRAERVATRRTSGDLPASTVTLLAQAEKDFANRDYAKAEENYLAVLRQDNQSAVTHANLAAAQMELGRLDEAEKHLQRALEISPEDAHSVSLLGYLKFRQEKYDEAVVALNRAAKLNPQNADIQNYLGVTLSHKGLRGPAEQAFRQAVVLSPGHAGAHNNLAVFYASEEPPNVPLARFHYQKALAAGHPPNPDIEKLFEKKEKAATNN